MELDHVVIAATDLGAAARELETQYGLASIDGGRHPGWGTANRIVPLGESYLELVAVVDAAEAAQSAFGRWVAAARGGLPLGWVVRTHELDEVARRLGLIIETGSRAAPSGQLLRWRSAAIERAAAEPLLPFFIEWGKGTPLPGRAAVSHRAGAVAISRLELTGDADRLAAWLGNHQLPIAVRPGEAAVTTIVLTGTAGEIVVD